MTQSLCISRNPKKLHKSFFAYFDLSLNLLFLNFPNMIRPNVDYHIKHLDIRPPPSSGNSIFINVDTLSDGDIQLVPSVLIHISLPYIRDLIQGQLTRRERSLRPQPNLGLAPVSFFKIHPLPTVGYLITQPHVSLILQLNQVMAVTVFVCPSLSRSLLNPHSSTRCCRGWFSKGRRTQRS